MLKTCMQNFFKSCKYFSVPLGTMFLGILLGISAAEWRGMELPIAWTERLIAALDLSALLSGLQTDAEGPAYWVALFMMAGFALGHALLRHLIRRSIARRTLRSTLLSGAIHTLLSAVGMLLGLWGILSWPVMAWLVPLLVLLFEDALTLAEAYVLYARGKVPFRAVFCPKTVVALTLSNTLVILLAVALTAAAVWISPLIGLFIGLTLISIAIIVTELNAEHIVQHMVGAAG